jgi:hypothetical protein
MSTRVTGRVRLSGLTVSSSTFSIDVDGQRTSDRDVVVRDLGADQMLQIAQPRKQNAHRSELANREAAPIDVVAAMGQRQSACCQNVRTGTLMCASGHLSRKRIPKRGEPVGTAGPAVANLTT